MLSTRLVTMTRNSAGAVSRRHLVFPHTSTINPHAPRSPTPIAISNFSTSRHRLATKQPPKDSSKSPEEPPPMNFSFEGLGMSRNTRIAVLVILSIFGTIESIFWISWIWELFTGKKDDGSESKA